MSERRVAQQQPAFVLHQWDWSETSLILDLFTRDQGRVAAVAKGAKRPYSQLRPVLMPFQRIQVAFNRGRSDEQGDIQTLRSAEYAAAGQRLPPARLFPGFYLNELLMKLLARGDAHAGLFDAYADTLQALAGGDADPDDQAPLRAFELRLLRETGVLPELDRDTTTQAPLQTGRAYLLQPEGGLVAAGRAGHAATGRDEPSLGAAQCQALERALAQADMAALRLACRGSQPALRQQLRGLLAHQIGSPMLRTRQVMLDVRRLLDPVAASTA